MANPCPIIVEGPDGSGKTTLANQLADALNRVYRRPPPAVLSSVDGPSGGELVSWWDKELGHDSQYLAGGVYDRCFYISDPIYQQAQVWRHLLLPDGADLARGITKLWNVEPIIIFCLPPFAEQLRNVQMAGRDRLKDVSDQALLKVSNAYWAYYMMWSLALYDNVLLYDYTQEDSWQLLTDRLRAGALT